MNAPGVELSGAGNKVKAMPHIDSTQFGEVVIDNKKYHQVLIIGEKVEERDCEKLKKLFDTSHKIGNWEIKELLSNNPEIIIIGTGQDGAMEPDKEIVNKFKVMSIEVIMTETPKAIGIYNEKAKSGKRINALIHTTC
ncbi:hypothetical protein KKF60_00055 [Patescibacteria group bacterium]|nr:hypothetical protein [Patescibacteria group bacterium]MBU4458295.1 hypothetical protein [Patescibacteria group bacterium]MCG2696210.1 MTH938/NDUFAF3 family protein [Candidatus Portnoybacteria bacterium]